MISLLSLFNSLYLYPYSLYLSTDRHGERASDMLADRKKPAAYAGLK